MIKSEIQIEHDIYMMLKDELKGIIEGSVYKSGCRPVDAETEDAVIVVSDASAEQIQMGNVMVNVYVPDIDGAPDKNRLTELSVLHEDLSEMMNVLSTDEYSFKPSPAARIYSEPDIRQHYVNFSFEFQRVTFNS